jgi:hypothetical protein
VLWPGLARLLLFFMTTSHLAKALLTHANAYRALAAIDAADKRLTLAEYRLDKAVDLLNGTYYLLKGLCLKNGLYRRRDGRATNTLLHQTLLWRIRCIAVQAKNPKAAEKDLQQLREVSEALESPSVTLETLREEARYWLAYYYADEKSCYLDNAYQALDGAYRIFDDLTRASPQSPYSHISLLRLDVELSSKLGEQYQQGGCRSCASLPASRPQ